MADELDPRLAAALARWRDEAAGAPEPAAQEAALLAMRSAVGMQTPVQSWSVAAWRNRLWAALAAARAHPRLVAATVAPLAVVSLTAAGWSSPAGAPLHFVELSRERTELALPGADRAGLELSFAERRLEDAAHSEAPAASLQEANTLLGDARRDLPANPPAQLASRLQADVEQLQKAAQNPVGPTPSPSPGAVPQPCAGEGQASAPATGRASPCGASPSPTSTPTGRPSPTKSAP